MSATATSPNLTSGRLLARNTIWNLLGQILPMAVAAVSMPLLVRSLGIDRFGLLSLAWVVVGYFGLFDLGIGRALTKLVADKLGADDRDGIPPLVWSSLLLMSVLGISGGALLTALSPWLIRSALHVPVLMQQETLKTFYLLALSIPVVILTSGVRGIMEAQLRFGIVNLIRIPLSVFSFLGPFLTIPFSKSLVPMVAVLLAGRLLGLLAYCVVCLQTIPQLRNQISIDRSVALSVIRFGGWMTVSNVLSPIMAYMDRFLIGSLLSLGAISYYTAPFDMITRMSIIPASLVVVLFPAFALTMAQDRERTAALTNKGIKYVYLTVFPIVLVIAAFAPEILRLWLGAAFAQHSTAALRWLVVGVFFNSLAQVPFSLIQGIGRPDVTAKLHMIELPFYLIALWFMTRAFGIEGTAMAWTVRMCADALLLLICSNQLLPSHAGRFVKTAAATGLGALGLYLSTLPPSTAQKVFVVTIVELVFGAFAWHFGGLRRKNRPSANDPDALPAATASIESGTY